MAYDFETLRPREGMGAEKWEITRTTDGWHPLGVMPFSVADMEFSTAPEILESLQRVLDLGILGYTTVYDEYRDAVAGWMKQRHGYEIDGDWIVPTYGVVSALYSAVRAFTEEGESVIIQTPVYPPFRRAVEQNGRTVVDCPLREENGRWEMDFEALERAAARPETRLAILCSPHNPVGRVWTEEELRRYGEICQKHGVLVVADEIHNDLVFAPNVHTMYASLGKAFEKNCILCTSPSKTFNLAGLTTSNIIVPDGTLRRAFAAQYHLDAGEYISAMGVPACIAAYTKGEPWLEELLQVLRGNMEYVRNFFEEKFPSVSVPLPEGTYLMWADFSAMGLTEEGLNRFLADEALFFVNDGRSFGPGGVLHRRINVACPHAALQEALKRVDEAAERLGIRR